jgi:hypothetical protein
MDRTTPAIPGQCACDVSASSGSDNRDRATISEDPPQISIAGLMAWALPPLILIAMLLVQSA